MLAVRRTACLVREHIERGAQAGAQLLGGDYVVDVTACGGGIFVATGLRMCGIKIFPVINMLPSMLIIMPLSALWARYVG